MRGGASVHRYIGKRGCREGPVYTGKGGKERNGGGKKRVGSLTAAG